VVLKGSVPSNDILDKVKEVAKGVNGAGAVDVDEVSIT